MPTYGGREKTEPLGDSGQGEVFLVRDQVRVAERRRTIERIHPRVSISPESGTMRFS